MNVCALRPLPDRVTVMDTSRLPLPLRVLVAMRCGGLGPRQQRLLENAGTRVHRVDVGPEDLDELLALCWRGQHDPPRVILDRDALMASRLAEKDAAGNYVYMVPSGLSILGCQVLQRLRSWHFGKPLTLVIGSTADDFAYALALDRCGLPAWWVPEPRSIQDDSIATRMLATLAASITSEWLPFEQSGRGSGVEACSLSIPRGDLKLLCTQVDKAGFGIFGTTLSDVARATVPSWRISLVTLRDHASEPLHEPFRHEHMLRPVSAAPPSGITSTAQWGLHWWVDIEDRSRQLPNRAALHELLLADPTFAAPAIRSGRDGISYHSLRGGLLLAGEPFGQTLARPRLRFPKATTVFRHLFERAGYRLEESAAGRYRRLTTDLWGGFDALHKDWADARTRALLKSWLSKERSGTDPGISTGSRRYLSLDDSLTASGIAIEDLRGMFDRYLKRGILRRGLVLTCAHCLNTDWYPLDDIAQSFMCSRCRTVAAITKASWRADHRHADPAPEPTFYYGLAEVAYQALDHDADVPIRALGDLRPNPEALVQDATDSEALRGDQRFELDLLALVDGRVIIGEAKKGDRLANTAREEVRQIRNLAEIAESITADEVVFATADAWRPATRCRIAEEFSNYRIGGRLVELGSGVDNGAANT